MAKKGPRADRKEFIERLTRAFDNDPMAEVARRLGVPHATVRNYYQGRHPAPEVLIKMSDESGVSLNWLLTGKGDMYAGGMIEPIGLGTFMEDKIAQMIGEMIDQKLEGYGLIAVGSSKPTKRTEPTEPAEPTEQTESAEPTDKAESTEPTESSESSESSESAVLAEPNETTESTEPTEEN
jgi:transcriptional regulator with XRE-family HTH domain